MIFAALSEAADKSELLLVDHGMCRWHLRRDGVIVIREVIVLPEARRKGLGRAMIEHVRRRLPCRKIVAKCPEEYESNACWETIGFTYTGTSNGINQWELLASSIALTETPAMPKRL